MKFWRHRISNQLLPREEKHQEQAGPAEEIAFLIVGAVLLPIALLLLCVVEMDVTIETAVEKVDE